MAFAEELLRTIDSNLGLVGVRRHPDLLTKHTMKMKGAQICELSEVGERNGLREIVVDVLTCPLHRGTFVTEASVGTNAGGGSRKESVQEIEQNLFLLKLGRAPLGRQVHCQEALPHEFVVNEEIATTGHRQITAGDMARGFVEGASVHVGAAKADIGLGVDPVCVNFAGWRNHEIAFPNQVRVAAVSKIAGPRGISAKMKFFVPMAGIRMPESCSTRKEDSVECRGAPYLQLVALSRPRQARIACH